MKILPGKPFPLGASFDGAGVNFCVFSETAQRIELCLAHDGFTLRDPVSYNEKHNQANGEDNRDGDGHNRSWNCGHEGETAHPDALELRAPRVY